GAARNPLDVTGYVVVDRTLLARALEIVAGDPGIDAVVLLSELPRVEPSDVAPVLHRYAVIAQVIAASPRPVIVVANTLTDVAAFGRSVQERTGFPHVVGGIEHGIPAIAAAVSWGRVSRERGWRPS